MCHDPNKTIEILLTGANIWQFKNIFEWAATFSRIFSTQRMEPIFRIKIFCWATS